jgi:hypothetical protein
MGTVDKIGKYIRFQVEKDQFELIANDAFKYAIISSPFTINRMGLDGLNKRIANITKGKLAEKLLDAFFKNQNIKVDFNSCETPYYQIDRRDFLWRDFEWDLKNNFLTNSELELDEKTMSQLPCLIPNRKAGDQWDRRNKLYFNSPKGSAYLFSFMIGRLINGPLENELIQVNLSKDQTKWLSELNEKYSGRSFKNEPLIQNDFWKAWEEIDIPELHQSFEIGFNSPIYFTAIANAADWPIFKLKKPQAFAKGIFKTRIDNMATEVEKLRSLSSIIPS